MGDQPMASTLTKKECSIMVEEVDAFTIAEFCQRHRISTKLFYKKPEEMPACFYVGTRRLISKESAAIWRRAREADAVAAA